MNRPAMPALYKPWDQMSSRERTAYLERRRLAKGRPPFQAPAGASPKVAKRLLGAQRWAELQEALREELANPVIVPRPPVLTASTLGGHIYRIRNTATGEAYIGRSVRVNIRLSTHKRELRQGNHHNTRLQRAWNKHGPRAFVFEIIGEYPLSQLCEAEGAALKLEQAPYNTVAPGLPALYKRPHLRR